VGMPEAVEDRQGTAQCSADIEANGAQTRRKPILPSPVLMLSIALFANPVSAVNRGRAHR
jgi:hypothetical protein